MMAYAIASSRGCIYQLWPNNHRHCQMANNLSDLKIIYQAYLRKDSYKKLYDYLLSRAGMED